MRLPGNVCRHDGPGLAARVAEHTAVRHVLRPRGGHVWFYGRVRPPVDSGSRCEWSQRTPRVFAPCSGTFGYIPKINASLAVVANTELGLAVDQAVIGALDILGV